MIHDLETRKAEPARLSMHAGGWNATEDEVAAVPVPERTRTYTPIPHAAVIGQIRQLVPSVGLKIERVEFGLAAEGQQLFGVADVRNGDGQPDWGLAVGFRNSYNKTLSLQLCAGSRVFVCDNLAFHSEVVLKEKHVGGLDNELPGMVAELLTRTVSFKERVTVRIERLKEMTITDAGAHDVICQAVRKQIISGSMTTEVLGQWYEPKHVDFEPRTAWSLFNGFTEVNKARSSAMQMKSTLQLTSLFDSLAGKVG